MTRPALLTCSPLLRVSDRPGGALGRLLLAPSVVLLALLGPGQEAMAHPGPPLPTQDDTELDEILATKAAEAETAELEALWRSAREVAILLGDEVGARFDAAVDRALGGSHGPRASLFLLATRLEGEDVDWELVGSALESILQSEDAAAITGAADLLGSAPGIQQQAADVREAIGEDLISLATNADRSPEQRVECAVAAHRNY